MGNVKTSYEVIEVKEDKKFKQLERENAMTVEGLAAEEDTYYGLIDFFKEYNAIDEDKKVVEFWIIKGVDMNEHYNLHGNNAYPDNLTIVNVPLTQLRSFAGIALPMRGFGARWYDDVVENNKRREKEMRSRR